MIAGEQGLGTDYLITTVSPEKLTMVDTFTLCLKDKVGLLHSL